MQLGHVDASLALHAQAMRLSGGEAPTVDTEQLLADLKRKHQAQARAPLALPFLACPPLPPHGCCWRAMLDQWYAETV